MSHLPERIVSLQPSATATLAALGQLHRLVAWTKYCIDLSWTAKAPEILAANPGLVIASVPYQEKAVSEILRAGIRFLALAPRTMADIYCDVATIADWLGCRIEENRSLPILRQQMELVRARVDGRTVPKVFCEKWGKPLVASRRWVAELVEAAGGEFIGEPGKQIQASEVVTANPDVIVAAWCGAGNRVPLEKIALTRGWDHSSASVLLLDRAGKQDVIFEVDVLVQIRFKSSQRLVQGLIADAGIRRRRITAAGFAH